MNVKDVNKKRIITFAILAMFLFSFSFALAEEEDIEASRRSFNLLDDDKETSVSGEEILADVRSSSIVDWFANWGTNTEINVNIIKYLLWILVSMMIWSVGHNIPGLERLFNKKNTSQPSLLGWAFAIIIGFLTMTFAGPAYLNAVIGTYGALGFTLASFLPFIILLFFTISLASTTDGAESSAAKNITTRTMAILMWVSFAGFQLIRSIRAARADEGSAFNWILTGAAIIMVIAMNAMWSRIGKLAQRDKLEQFNRRGEKIRAVDRNKQMEFDFGTK